MAASIVVNAKMRRTGVCGAAETLLIDRACSLQMQRQLVNALLDAGCEVRGDAGVRKLEPRVIAAKEKDWGFEFLGPVIAAKLVDGVDQAIAHIRNLAPVTPNPS